MAKLLRSRDWFVELSPNSYYKEIDLERTIITNLGILFPDFCATKFKVDVHNDNSLKPKRPDLALIRKDYKEWYVIEVELSTASFVNVLEQIRVFHNGDYKVSHAKYLYEQNRSVFSLPDLENMITNITPKLMVIVNEHNDDWEAQLSPFECDLCVFQIYKHKSDEIVYRLSGKHPFTKTDFTSCTLLNVATPTLEIQDTGFLDGHGFLVNQSADISYKGKVTKWFRIDEGGIAYISCDYDSFNLDPLTHRYMLSFDQANSEFAFFKF